MVSGANLTEECRSMGLTILERMGKKFQTNQRIYAVIFFQREDEQKSCLVSWLIMANNGQQEQRYIMLVVIDWYTS